MGLAFLAVSALAGLTPSDVLDLPAPDVVFGHRIPSDNLVYDRTGTQLLADLHPPGYRHYERSLDEMGPYLPAATVAVEDANFWNEPGVDPIGIARAGVSDFRAGTVVEGGSTITQQLVKLRVLGDDTTYSRKLRESILAVQLSSRYTKSRILELYLNSIPYGHGAYGAEAAAELYFHTDAAHLDLAQAALLAGLPQQPTRLDPLAHWDAAKRRQAQVLTAMVRAQDITQTEADVAAAEDLSPPGHLFATASPDLAPMFVDLLTAELARRFGQDIVSQGGLRIVSSLDMGLQERAKQMIASAVAANHDRDASDGALVAIDPRTGDILALVGSAGPGVPGGDYNMAVWPPRNPGSTFKLFTYATAIASRRYTMVSQLADAPLTIEVAGATPYSPVNGAAVFHGSCALQVCFGSSLNVPAVEAELGVGTENVVKQARAMGAPPFQRHGDTYRSDDSPSSFGPSLTLGGYGETPLQMATAASALAAGGVLHPARTILRAEGASGARDDAGSGAPTIAVDRGTAFIVSQILSNDANRTLTFGASTPLSLPGHHAAAKTGTTDDFTDAWTIGYTPSLATAVWLGNADAHPMKPGSDGIVVAAPAWHDFMQSALNQLHVGDERFDVPPGITSQDVNGQPAYFLPGTNA